MLCALEAAREGSRLPFPVLEQSRVFRAWHGATVVVVVADGVGQGDPCLVDGDGDGRAEKAGLLGGRRVLFLAGGLARFRARVWSSAVKASLRVRMAAEQSFAVRVPLSAGRPSAWAASTQVVIPGMRRARQSAA